MTLAQLQTFIRETRRLQGVCWYLVDTSPLEFRNVLHELYVFDSDKNLVCTVANIEEHGKAIPMARLQAIANARLHAGIDPTFIAYGHKGNVQAARKIFDTARSNWGRTHKDVFLAHPENFVSSVVDTADGSPKINH